MPNGTRRQANAAGSRQHLMGVTGAPSSSLALRGPIGLSAEKRAPDPGDRCPCHLWSLLDGMTLWRSSEAQMAHLASRALLPTSTWHVCVMDQCVVSPKGGQDSSQIELDGETSHVGPQEVPLLPLPDVRGPHAASLRSWVGPYCWWPVEVGPDPRLGCGTLAVSVA